MYLKGSGLPSHLFLSTPIPDTPHPKERDHQEKGNGLLKPLATQEGVGTHSLRTREKLGGLLYYSHHKAA